MNTDFKWFESLWMEIEKYFDHVAPTFKRFQVTNDVLFIKILKVKLN